MKEKDIEKETNKQTYRDRDRGYLGRQSTKQQKIRKRSI